jgi:hypothetical protein
MAILALISRLIVSRGLATDGADLDAWTVMAASLSLISPAS